MTTTVEVLAAAFKDAGTPFIVGHPGGVAGDQRVEGRQPRRRDCRPGGRPGVAQSANDPVDLGGSLSCDLLCRLQRRL